MLSEGSVRVHGVQLSDTGRYYCTVSNQAGSDHRGMDLRVFGETSYNYSRHLSVILCCRSSYGVILVLDSCHGLCLFLIVLLSG